MAGHIDIDALTTEAIACLDNATEDTRIVRARIYQSLKTTRQTPRWRRAYEDARLRHIRLCARVKKLYL